MSAGFWTPERERDLRVIAQSGASASDAGRALGCTRDAAKSRARRLGIVFTATAGTRAIVRRKPAAAQCGRVARDFPPVAFLDTGPGQCRFILGDEWTSAALCCAAPVAGRSSYCARHHKRTHRRPRRDGDRIADHFDALEKLTARAPNPDAEADAAFVAMIFNEHKEGMGDDASAFD